ncbi:hypothetical protein IL252_14320 (plasmid) [Halomicrobium sp. IBSBa]|uniref:DUF7504 family protein n=1 Tax=Halomicrobium sp. IBSBa TaxID=2778916 RepID=UPI001ABF7B19|nr:hypothetical protein [Halomicrobium sp. IBSBa]MBO4248993.1 hypothetical protein [Halomicrobium sp. IBSBa]
MDGSSESPPNRDGDQINPFPDGLAGSTVLLAGTVEPASYDVGLRALSRYGTDGDTALVVATTESADETVARYDALLPDAGGPKLGLVDTASEQKSVSARYGEYPIVYIPAPNDLERLVIGLSDLTGDLPPSSGTRHLLVRSLTPLLQSSSVETVSPILERISDLRTESGLTLFSIDYTAHSEDMLEKLSEHVDGILWVTEQSGTLSFEYHRTDGRHNRPAGIGDLDN